MENQHLHITALPAYAPSAPQHWSAFWSSHHATRTEQVFGDRRARDDPLRLLTESHRKGSNHSRESGMMCQAPRSILYRSKRGKRRLICLFGPASSYPRMVRGRSGCLCDPNSARRTTFTSHCCNLPPQAQMMLLICLRCTTCCN